MKSGLHGENYWIGSGKPQKLINYVNQIKELFPMAPRIQVGQLPYNDIKLPLNTFDISKLKKDTNFIPKISFKESLIELIESF